MNAIHAHLIITHFPIVLLLVGLALLLWSFRAGIAVRNVALYTIIAAALFAGLAVLSGDSAEKVAEHLPGVNESLIHEHEEAAEAAMWLTVAAGVLALGTRLLATRANRWLQAGSAATLLLSLGATGAVGYAASLGGRIRHPEIVNVTAASTNRRSTVSPAQRLHTDGRTSRNEASSPRAEHHDD